MRFSSTDSGAITRRPSGTWITPRRALWYEGRRLNSRPPNSMEPVEGTMPVTALTRLDLPAPLGPMSVKISPCLICSDTPRSAVMPW